MEKKPKTQKKKNINLNFNFSDDDSEDDVFQPQVKTIVRKLQLKKNNASPQNVEQKDMTIISGEYLCRQTHLASFMEDIGAPIMDSTHVFGDSGSVVNERKLSVCTNITKEISERIKAPVKLANSSNPKAIHDESLENHHDQEENTRIKLPVGKENISPSVDDTIRNNQREIECHENSCSFVEVEVQDTSIQTSVMYDDSYLSKNNHDSNSNQFDSTTDGKTNSITPLYEDNRQTSSIASTSTCSQKDEFTTALEDSILKSQSLKSDSFTGSRQSSIGSVKARNSRYENSTLSVSSNCSTQDPSSYCYVQDASLQTNLSQSQMNPKSPHGILSQSNTLSPKAKTSSLNSTPRFQNLTDDANNQKRKLPPVVGNYRTPDVLLNMFDKNSPIVQNATDVLAADSDEEFNSDKIIDHNSKHCTVIADSEDDEVIETEIASKKKEEETGSPGNLKHYSENISQSEKEASGMTTEILETDELQASNELCLRWSATQEDTTKSSQLEMSTEIDKVTSSLGALSFHRTQKRRNSSSSEDDNFEDFLTKLKGDQEKKNEQDSIVPSMNEFIVDDDNSLSSDGDGDHSQSNDEDDGKLFYIKTDNKLNRERKGKRVPVEKTYVYYTSSSSEYEHQSNSDSDLSDFIVDDEKFKHKTIKKSHGLPQGFGDEEKVGDLPKSADARKPDFPFSNGGDLEKSDYKAKKKLNLETPKHKSFTPSKSLKGAANIGSAKTDSTPLTKTKVGPSRFTSALAWSSESDDDFVESKKDTPSRLKLPIPPGLSSFKTPKPVSKSTTLFETPVNKKGPITHPWTAPRAVKNPSKSSTEEDDNSFFLKSLSSDYAAFKRHPEAARYVKNFKALRQELTEKLFNVFNKTVFKSQIPSTLNLEWNARYRKTAGTFSYKRSNPSMGRITLSVKVCDRPERVRDTLAHELCHAATRIVNGADEQHGPVWKSWARKVNAVFPFMPIVARCHDYIIHSKYTYQCVNCKYRICRHSKSLDTERKVCGHCKGEFQVFLTSELNSSSNSSTSATPKTPRTPNKFALFVKECYSEVKKRNADYKHGDIMKELSKEFAEKNKIQP